MTATSHQLSTLLALLLMAGASQARRDSIINANQKQRHDSADQQGVQDALLYSVYSPSGSRPEEEEEEEEEEWVAGSYQTKVGMVSCETSLFKPEFPLWLSYKEGIGTRWT